MSNVNRDYAIVYDVKNSSLVLSRPLVFYITDQNTSNIFVRLVTKVNIGNGVDQYTDIEEASSYALTMRVIKPNSEVKSIEATQHELGSIFQFDLTEDFKDIPGKYICELIISTIVSERQELITSDPFNYEVKRSILSNVSEIIETEDTTVEKLLNNLEASKIRLFNDLELAKTNLRNDLNATSSALNSQVQDSNNKIEDIKEELSSRLDMTGANLSSQIKDIAVNIRDFGALGNGVKDDTQAIKNAIDYIEKGVVLIPEGKYLITETIFIQKEKSIIFEGQGESSQLLILSNQEYDGTRIEFINTNNIIFKNIAIKSVNTTPKRSNLYGELTFNNCTNVKVDNCSISRTNGVALYFINECENVDIEKCKIFDTEADGIHMNRGCKNFRITMCDIYNVKDDCIGFVSHDFEGKGNNKGIEIFNNRLHDTIVTGSGICCDGSHGITIHDNIIYNTILSGIRINPMKETNQTNTAYPKDVVIYNNRISNIGSGTTGNMQGITISLCENVNIYNNNISTIKDGGIFATGVCGNIYIKNNTLYDITNIGIWVTSNSILDNNRVGITVENNNADMVTIDGIRIDCVNLKAEYVIVKSNVFTKINNSNTSGSIYGIFINESDFTVVENNILLSYNTISPIGLTNCLSIRRQYNYPVDNEDTINIGTSTHTFAGTPPTKAKAGDVCWNWNPPAGVLMWYCKNSSTESTDAEWIPINWTSLES